MTYQFDAVVDRSRNHSAKYDERKKKFGTEDVIPLWIADMDFKTAQPIIDALKARAEEGIWGYTARPDSYFEAIRGWQKRRNGWDIDQSLMSFSLGVVQTLSACVKLFTPEGGSVLIQTPVYSEFYDMTEAWSRKVLENQFVEKDGKWTVDWADFEEKLKQADLFLLCSPHNPLGHVWTEEELRRMMELCLKHHVLVDLVGDHQHQDLQPGRPAGQHGGVPQRAQEGGLRQVLDEHGHPPEQRLLPHRHGGGLQPGRGVAGPAAALSLRQL